MFEDVRQRQAELSDHHLYRLLNTPEAVQTFMEHHVFAVWDFMTLLKSLQCRLTCVTIPWKPAAAPAEVTRFINEIVIGEESDLNQRGEPVSHYEMYLAAMDEVGADSSLVREYVRFMDDAILPPGVDAFVTHDLALAEEGHDEEVAAAFLFGREKLIPEMFERILAALGPQAQSCPQLIYYLERHIELDGDEHGPMAESCLQHLIGDDPQREQRARSAAFRALALRDHLWNVTADRISAQRAHIPSVQRARA